MDVRFPHAPLAARHSMIDALLQTAERSANAGFWDEAERLLEQTWAASTPHDHALTDHIAWAAARLALRHGQAQAAAAWLERTAQPPGDDTRWREMRGALAQLCRAAHDQTSPAAHRGAQLLPLGVVNMGRFQITRAGSVLPTCAASRAIALFRYLLLKEQRQAHKEELMELFWADAHPCRASHSLHVAVSALRGYLDSGDESYILFDQGYYGINPSAPIADDCADFIRLSDAAERHWEAANRDAALPAYEQAIACYRGDYDIGTADMLWTVVERERLLMRYLTALHRLGQGYLAQGRFEQAVTCFERLLARDNYREDACYHLMRCYVRLGRRQAALQEYHRCAEALARDLGVEPMEELQSLYRSLVHHSTEDQLARTVGATFQAE